MNAEEFKRRYLVYHATLYRIIYRCLGNAEDSEDVLQEFYIKLWQKRDTLDSIENVESYCIAIVRNMAIDYLRTHQYRRQESDIEKLQIDIEEVSVARKIEEENHWNCVLNLIDRLPEQQRKVMKLRHEQERSLKEIEEITGISASNVRVILSRCRTKLQDQIKKIMSYEER